MHFVFIQRIILKQNEGETKTNVSIFNEKKGKGTMGAWPHARRYVQVVEFLSIYLKSWPTEIKFKFYFETACLCLRGFEHIFEVWAGGK